MASEFSMKINPKPIYFLAFYIHVGLSWPYQIHYEINPIVYLKHFQIIRNKGIITKQNNPSFKLPLSLVNNLSYLWNDYSCANSISCKTVTHMRWERKYKVTHSFSLEIQMHNMPHLQVVAKKTWVLSLSICTWNIPRPA